MSISSRYLSHSLVARSSVALSLNVGCSHHQLLAPELNGVCFSILHSFSFFFPFLMHDIGIGKPDFFFPFRRFWSHPPILKFPSYSVYLVTAVAVAVSVAVSVACELNSAEVLSCSKCHGLDRGLRLARHSLLFSFDFFFFF